MNMKARVKDTQRVPQLQPGRPDSSDVDSEKDPDGDSLVKIELPRDGEAPTVQFPNTTQ